MPTADSGEITHPPHTNPIPTPDREELSRAMHMRELINAEITRCDGRLPFDRFMELALYAPGLGYYAMTQPVGAGGDFTTAPEISPLFGACVARQCAQVLTQIPTGELLELGAGNGTLAADLLDELVRLDCLPERYRILEVSPALRARQQFLLAERHPALFERIEWLDSLPEPGFRGVVFANELLDAMPVNLFQTLDGKILEGFVSNQDKDLVLDWAEPASPGLEKAVMAIQADVGRLPDGYRSEINMRLAPWFSALTERLDQALVLLIDYGYSRREFYHAERAQGTLVCHYQQKANFDPLWSPGLQDLSANVDFTAVADAGIQAGLQLAGYTNQAQFLMGSGLTDILGERLSTNPDTQIDLNQGIKQLTLPSEMGERFKVIGLTRGLAIQPVGFAIRDFRDRL